MLISVYKLRKIIRENLLKEISLEKWQGEEGKKYREIYNDKKDTRGEGEYYKDKIKNFKYNPQSGLKPTYLGDLKKWWMENADQDFFNNQKDLNDKKEEIIVIHDLSAYEGQGIEDIDVLKFYNEREKYYKNPGFINRNELSAIGYINLDKKDAYEICKEKIGSNASTGKLNVFLYLNNRKITAAGGGSGDLGTEVFSSYPKKSGDKNHEFSKKKEFLKKLENYKLAKTNGLNTQEIYEKFGITQFEGFDLEKFIIKPKFNDISDSLLKGGKINNVEYTGIFDKFIDKENIYQDINYILNKYKSNIISDNLKNNLVCNENIINNLKNNFNVFSNDAIIYINFEILLVFLVVLMFGGSLTFFNVNLSYIFLSRNAETSEALKRENINIGFQTVVKFCNQDNEIKEYLKRIWLSSLKYFFIKNQKDLKIKNEEITLTINKERLKDFDDIISNFISGYRLELNSFSINQSEVKKYLNSSYVKDGVEKSYEDATKQSGTRKYPAAWQYDMGKIDNNIDNRILNSNILDKEEVTGRKYIDEVIVGNWKIDSVWFNLNFNDFDFNIKNDKNFIHYIDNLNDSNKKFILCNLYYFMNKGFKCFDKNGNELKL